MGEGQAGGTLVAFLLDRTGSMGEVKAQTIEGFNAYLDGLDGAGDGVEVSVLQFDSISIDVLCVDARPADVPRLTDASYQPRASTPLIDAAVKTIRAVEAAVAGRAVPPKVVVTFQTDGEENCSTEHGWIELNLLVKDKVAQGWEFNFLGAGIDAYAQGARMGLGEDRVMSYDKGALHETRLAFTERAGRAARYAKGEEADMAIPLAAKVAAGDRYAKRPNAEVRGTPDLAAKPAPRRRRAMTDQPKL